MNPAVYTRTIMPHKALEPYIKYYAIRKFDTQDHIFPKAVIAHDEIEINFFLTGKLYGFDSSDNSGYQYNKNNSIECYFTSLQTSTKGFVLFKGATNILTIHFKPTGFYNIFDISPKELMELHGETKNILGNDINILYEQMCEANDMSKSVYIIQKYLLKKLFLRKITYRHLSILAAANLLIKKKGIYTIKKITDEFNITQQALEIQFKNQVGIDPKTYCRLLRFKYVVNMKIYNPTLTWTSIAHDCGFYDQMHLIKDFKNFSGLSPKEFIEIIHPPIELFMEE